MVISPTAFSKTDFREFKNAQGQTVIAKPVSVVGKLVRIKLESGREMNVKPAIFVEADQKYLENWTLTHLSEEDRLFAFESKRKTGNVKKSEDTGIKIKEFDGYYQIRIKNKSEIPLNNLRVEYRTFSVQDNVAKKDRHDVTYKKANGSKKIKLGKLEEITFDTTPIKLRETKLKGGWSWSGGGDTKNDAKMAGIWYRVYSNNMLVGEFSDPTNLKDKQEW